jgi:hypothetical protein
MAIDRELDQLKQQYPERTENPGLEVTMKLLALLPQLGPVISVIHGIRDHFSWEYAIRRLERLFNALETEVLRQGKTVEGIKEQLETPEALDSLIRAVNVTIQISNEWKIEKFGELLGYEAASDDREGWDEASALIDDLNRLTQADIETLRLLVHFQSKCVKEHPTTIDYNDLVASMKEILTEVDARKIARGEFYSRAFRLVGFGLAVPLNWNQFALAPEDQALAATVRGVRLIKIVCKEAGD